jgi:flagellar biosynthesis chaperone FliJ
MSEDEQPDGESENQRQEDVPDDFDLNDPYSTLENHDIYAEDNRRGKAFGVLNTDSKDEFVRMLSKSKKPYTDSASANRGFNVYSAMQIDKLFNALRSISRKLGWEAEETEEIDKLKNELQEKNETIANLRSSVNEQKEILRNLREEQEKYLKSRVREFQETLDELEEKLDRAKNEEIEEEELQEFLKENPWLFGAEYASSEPKKLRGAENEFDFFLERYNGVNDIIELKRISDDILRSSDGKIAAKVTRAVDQCIGYMKQTIAASHNSVISEQEGIEELRPRGVIITGHDASEETEEKLEDWNYRLNNIEIMTYNDIYDKAQNTLEKIKVEEDKNE